MNEPLGMRLRTFFASADQLFRVRGPRERLLLAGMAIAAVAFVLDSVALRPLEAMRADAERSRTSQAERISGLESRIDALRHPVIDEAERARRDEIRQLNAQIAEIDARIGGAVSRLVPPESAVEVLEELLTHDDRLSLVALTSQEPRRLGPEQTRGTSTLYQHGLKLEIQGDFASTVDYLRRIEESEWQLLWDRFEYRVESHPEAHITIELHTLSEREEWVGV
jgi:MSHA biogenesis protein MshJ